MIDLTNNSIVYWALIVAFILLLLWAVFDWWLN